MMSFRCTGSLPRWVMALGGVLFAGMVQGLEPIQGEIDNRDYRYLTLENGLQVLLVADPEADKAAAAMDVHVGHHQAPMGREGLAHLLEHVLPLGSEKYPEPDEFQAFIGRHGGHQDAYTAAEHTNYYFEIDPNHLEPALDRFSQHFIAPLLDPDSVERGQQGVHSEYKARLMEETRRLEDVYRELMNPAHPASRFDIGHLNTLADTEERPLRDDLVRFYHQYYSSDLMALVVLGRESLDELEALVEERFSKVPRRDVTVPETYPPLFLKAQLPLKVEVASEKETRQLSLLFPVPNDSKHYQAKPLQYVSHILGHEGEGSLLSLLKALGWAEGISAGPRYGNRHDTLFEISVDLTELGVLATDQIVALAFHTIEQARSRGLAPWRYRELQQMAEIDFRFSEKLPPLETVSGLAYRMHFYQPQDILRGDSLYADYDARLIRRYLGYMNSANVLVSVQAPEVEAELRSSYYQTPYSTESISDEQPAIKTRIQRRLNRPEPNEFIPSRLEVKEAPLLPGPRQVTEATQDRPELVVDKSRIRVWYQWDNSFSVPKTSLRLRLMLPVVASGLEGAARVELLTALVQDQLNEFAYPAQLAGLDFAIEPHGRGLDIEIYGYNGRQNLLLTKIVEALRRSRFEQERFDEIKRKLLKEWRDQQRQSPYAVIAGKVPRLQLSPFWLGPDKMAAVEATDLEQLQEFSEVMLKDAHIEALFYGNLYRQEAVRLSAYIEHQLLGEMTRQTLAPARLYRIEPGDNKPWVYTYPLDHDDRVALLYVQGLSTDIEDAAHMQLLRQMLRPAFFHQLHTEKQLGYVTTIFGLPIREQEGTALVVQSPNASADQLWEEIDAFLSVAEQYLSKDLLEKHQSTLAEELREPAQTLYQQSRRHWEDLKLGDRSFQRRDRLADAVEQVSLASLKAYYRRVFADSSRRLWLLSEAADPERPIHRIESIEGYQRDQEVLIYP